MALPAPPGPVTVPVKVVVVESVLPDSEPVTPELFTPLLPVKPSPVAEQPPLLGVGPVRSIGSLSGAALVTGAGVLSPVCPPSPPATATEPAVNDPPPPVNCRASGSVESTMIPQFAAETVKEPCNSIASEADGLVTMTHALLTPGVPATARAATVMLPKLK